MSQVDMKIHMLEQPDDLTCGPTSLHAVYRYWGLDLDLHQVIAEVGSLSGGGTLATILGIDALRRGFAARIYSYNLKIFDPSWTDLSPADLIERLGAQLSYKKGKRFTVTTQAYIDFIASGGEMGFTNLTEGLLREYFDSKQPVLAGLSATYLYRSRREYSTTAGGLVYDDLKGDPTGHFVVLHGIRDSKVTVADPYRGNPLSEDHHYAVDVLRLINAIMLGTVTYDANLLVIAPAKLH